jgi:hypothetical protein
MAAWPSSGISSPTILVSANVVLGSLLRLLEDSLKL